MEFESFTDALNDCVRAIGGSKKVGRAIWPYKDEFSAQRHLLNCLNPDRAEKLHLDELLMLMKMARDRGCHAGMQYLAETLGYSLMSANAEPKGDSQ